MQISEMNSISLGLSEKCLLSLLLTNIYTRQRILISINTLTVSFHVFHYFPREKSVHLIRIVVPLNAIYLFPPLVIWDIVCHWYWFVVWLCFPSVYFLNIYSLWCLAEFLVIHRICKKFLQMYSALFSLLC